MNAPFLRQNSAQSKPTRKKRIGALSVLPVFFNLHNKHVVVIGGTEATAWKAELLSAAGAKVHVHAASLSKEFSALIAATPHQFFMRKQHQLATDIADAALLICDAPSDQVAKQVCAIAKLYGVPTNIIDRPSFCDFQFGSIVNRSPAVVAISTGGAAPIFGQAIRRRIEMVLPQKLALWAQLARDFRAQANALLAPGRERRDFWEAFVDNAFGGNAAPMDENMLLDQCQRIATTPASHTKITRIGYCENDPELITIKAMRALQSADVIVHASSTPVAILELARREAKRICVDDVTHANTPTGGHTVKLIAGDPCLFDQAEMGAPNTTSCVPETA